MKWKLIAGTVVTAKGLVLSSTSYTNKPVGITPDTMSVTAMHGGNKVEIKRNQDVTAHPMLAAA